jgi:prevent-host-death family protein
MDKISALTLRKKLGSVLDDVVDKKKAVTITRNNKPLVAIVPYEEYEKGEARAVRLGGASAKMDKLRQKLAPKLRGLDTAAVIRELRERR